MSLSNQIIDFNDDINKVIFKQLIANIPEQIKTASVVDSEKKQSLNEEEFALVILTKEGSTLKKFPINDAANTWLSAQYFAKTAEKLPVKARVIAAGHLKTACAFHNVEIPEKLQKVAGASLASNRYTEAYDMTKVAHVTPEFEKVAADGSKDFYALRENYAMPSAEFVKKAAAFFIDFKFDFDAADRNEYASNVLSRANTLGVDLGEQRNELRKFAGEGYGDNIGLQIRKRQSLLDTKPELSHALSKLASHRETTEASTFAKALHAFDKKAGFERYYGSYLDDAYKSTFDKDFSKEASGYTWESGSGDISVSEKELVKAAEEKYETIKGYFGETLAKQFKKHGSQIFASLPDDAKEVIAKIAKGKV